MKKLLFVIKRLPHSGHHVQENLDMILTAAAFDQDVSLLFLDDGLLQLKTQQQADVSGLKDTAAVFQVLDLYNVDKLYVETESLQQRGLSEADLILPVQLLARDQVNAFMQQHAIVIAD
jgi:tRNA 2-thiouridine synthesizing protein C